MTPGLITSSRKLHNLYKKKLGENKEHPAYAEYNIFCNTYNRLKRITKFNYYNELLTKYRHDIRKTWGVINTLISRTNDKTSISDTFKINGNLVSNPQMISNEFCDFFTNIGKKYSDAIPPAKYSCDHYLRNKSSTNIFLSPTGPFEITRIINSLKSKNSSGHDGLNTILLKNIKTELVIPLNIIINKSLSTGVVPDSLKLAKVIPIFKCKEKDNLNNYRPISLLPTISKILEKVLHKRLYNFLLSQSIFYQSRYGFRPKHATSHAVNEFVDDVISSFENKEVTLGVFLDLSQAFDTINHKILLQKLEWYGVRGKALEWFENYLCQRKQFVQYKTNKSLTHNIPCGVPQGSVLGPLLFIIYTNDLPNSLTHTKAILLADDTTLYLNSKHVTELFNLINHDLNSLAEWFKSNKLSLNIGKNKLCGF